MSSSTIHNDDTISIDSNRDYENLIKNLEKLEGFNLGELKDIIEKGLDDVYREPSIIEETKPVEARNSASNRLINYSFVKPVVNSIKSNSNWSCVGRTSSSIKSVSFKDVIEDDMGSRVDEHSGKGDQPLTPYDSENCELFKKFVVKIADQNSNSTELFSDMDNVKKEGCIQTDSFHSILKHDDFDEMAISETLLALIDQKNKYISHLQNKVHNQKVQLQFYLQKTFNNSTIKALSQTCDPYIMEDNINLNMAMKRFCKQEGVKTTLMHLHERMTELEGNIYDLLDNQDTVIQEMAKVLQAKEDENHSSSMVMRSMVKQLGNSPCYECLQKNYFSLLKIRREMFHFRNSCEKILNIEDERNRIVEQVYSMPADQRINCNILASIQFDKFRIEEEFEQIKEEQKRIENRLYIGEHLEKYFKCMANDGVVQVPLQQNKINEYLERQLDTANSDGLSLLTIIHKQKAKYTQELHTLFLANRQLTEEVEELQKAVQEREALLQKFIYKKHSALNSDDVTSSGTNVFSSQKSNSELRRRKKKGSLATELEGQLQALGDKLRKENTENGKLEIELSLRSSSGYKNDVSQRFNEQSLRLSDKSEKIISNAHHKWKLRTAETEFDKKLKEILDQKEEYLQDIKDLTKIVRGQELQIKHLLIIIDKLRPHIQPKEQVNCDSLLELKDLTHVETQTDEIAETKVEHKEAYVQTVDQDTSESKRKSRENRSEMRSMIDVLRDCAENVKTIFRTSSSDYSLRSSFKKQPEIRFTSYTSEKLVDFPDKYIGSNNTTCLEQLSKEDDSKSETLPRSSNAYPFCPLIKPFQCLLGLSKHKSESVITTRKKQQALIDNINATFKLSKISGLLQLKDLQDTCKHIKFAAEIHETPPINHSDNSPITSEEKICESSKKEEESDVNIKQDTEGSQNVSSFDVLSMVNEESNEENSSRPTNKQNVTLSSIDSKRNSGNSNNEKGKMDSSRKSNKSSVGSNKSQQNSSTAQQQSLKSTKSFKQLENENKSFSSSTSVRKKSGTNAYDPSKSERPLYAKNQEFVVNYVTDIKPKSEISLKDKSQKSEKSVPIISQRSEKSIPSATHKPKPHHSIISIKDKVNYPSQTQPHMSSLTCFQKCSNEADNSITHSYKVKTTSIVDEILQKEINNIKREFEVISRTFDWKSGKSLTEIKQKLENSLSESKHDSERLSTHAPLDTLKSASNGPRNSELSLTDSEQKTEKNIEQLPERSSIRDERDSEPLMVAKEQLKLKENYLKVINDCSPKHLVSTKCNYSQTTTTLKVEMTDTEGKLHHISATFESSDELQGIIEIDDNSVVHVKLLCGNAFQQSPIGIEKISDDIVQNYKIKSCGEASNDSCRESGKEIFQEYNVSGVVCKRKGSFAAKAFSVTSVLTEIPMAKSTSSFGMCAEMTDKLKVIVMEMDKKLETPEGKKEVLESLRSLCSLPSREDVSRTNSCSSYVKLNLLPE